MRRHTAAFAILVGGSIAGALDITYAIVFSGIRGVPAIRLLQSVASGLLGSAAFEGGVPAAALGLFLHFIIAFSAAAVFYVASRRFQSPDPSGSRLGCSVRHRHLRGHELDRSSFVSHSSQSHISASGLRNRSIRAHVLYWSSYL